MAYLKALKKGGVARYAIQKVALNDSIVLPRGFKIDYMWAETGANALTGAVNLALGSVQMTPAVTTLAITGTATAAVATTFTVDGVAWTVTAPSIGATADQLADLLLATPLEGVVVTKTGTATLRLAFLSAGDKTVTLSTANGYACTPAKTVTGTAQSVDIVAAAAVTTTAKTITKFTPVAGKDYRNTAETSDLTCYLSATNGYGANPLKPINVYIGISKIN